MIVENNKQLRHDIRILKCDLEKQKSDRSQLLGSLINVHATVRNCEKQLNQLGYEFTENDKATMRENERKLGTWLDETEVTIKFEDR